MTTSLLAVLGTGVVDPTSPVVRADDAGLVRGDGCFEGCRLRPRTRTASVSIDKLDAHLARMTRSASSAGHRVRRAGLARPRRRARCRPGRATDEAAVKLLLSRGSAGAGAPTGFVWIIRRSGPRCYERWRRDGVSAITLRSWGPGHRFRRRPWLLGGVKTLSYAINMAAAREAERRGADDVIFVSDDGYVLESPTSTVVWARHGDERTLHTTPTGATGILGGTTQQLLFERAARNGWRTAYTLVPDVDDLHAADAVWLDQQRPGPGRGAWSWTASRPARHTRTGQRTSRRLSGF